MLDSLYIHEFAVPVYLSKELSRISTSSQFILAITVKIVYISGVGTLTQKFMTENELPASKYK